MGNQVHYGWLPKVTHNIQEYNKQLDNKQINIRLKDRQVIYISAGQIFEIWRYVKKMWIT